LRVGLIVPIMHNGKSIGGQYDRRCLRTS
jgi:hypothetical protein